MKIVFKIRSRSHEIITTTEPEKHDVVWKREFNPEIYPMDRPKSKESNLKQNFMKASNPFKESIKSYLDNRATEDELFAVTYKKENKNLDECCKYIMEQAQKGGCGGYSDEEVFGWAIHYYDEDNIKNVKGVSGKVIVNRPVELSPEELEKAKAAAIELATQQKADEIKKDLVVNVSLTPEEITNAKADAIAKVHEEARNKMLQKKVVKSKPKETTPALSLEANTKSKAKSTAIKITKEPIIDPNGQSSLF